MNVNDNDDMSVGLKSDSDISGFNEDADETDPELITRDDDVHTPFVRVHYATGKQHLIEQCVEACLTRSVGEMSPHLDFYGNAKYLTTTLQRWNRLLLLLMGEVVNNSLTRTTKMYRLCPIKLWGSLNMPVRNATHEGLPDITAYETIFKTWADQTIFLMNWRGNNGTNAQEVATIRKWAAIVTYNIVNLSLRLFRESDQEEEHPSSRPYLCMCFKWWLDIVHHLLKTDVLSHVVDQSLASKMKTKAQDLSKYFP